MSTVHFVSTAPACRSCARCGRLELTALAEGLPVRVEPAPLTAAAELAALLAGRRSYALLGNPNLTGTARLAHRDATRITGDHHRGRPPVYATHHCAHPAAPGDIDPTHLATTAPLIATKKDPYWGQLATTENALFAVAGQLGGRVVADIPPF